MPWRELRNRLETLAANGDFVAEWRFAPDKSHREIWTLRMRDWSSRDAVLDVLDQAGRALEEQYRGRRLAPDRIFDAAISPVKAWLSVLRRNGIGVQRVEDFAWRVDQGKIQGVIGASIAFCDYLGGRHGRGALDRARRQADAWSLALQTENAEPDAPVETTPSLPPSVEPRP